ncbi:MAG: ATP-binding domain-containing protein [Oscillospiraceae bacterium]|nr:ATP-binding domain-containing protein [Oscillospiraceae bacterium]
MTYPEYRDQAVRSAELYYDYLAQEGKGTAETKVSSISILQNGFVKLFLSGRLASTDDTQIKVLNRLFSADEIMPVRYDKNERSLLVRPRTECLSAFYDRSPREITVISDLKFLVRRVGRWYESHPAPFGLPEILPLPPSEFPVLTASPSEEQSKALSGILHSPISYVWGAPGTGKTQFVLARAVLSYCLQGKPVLITAPTNNAVEQTLNGVLAVLEEAGIPLEKVLRLGVPSIEFFKRYPMVCEVQSIEKELQQIETDISFYQKSLLFHSSLTWHREVSSSIESTRSRLDSINQKSEALNTKLQETKSMLCFKTSLSAPALSQLELKGAERETLLSFIQTKRSSFVSWLQKRNVTKAKNTLHQLDVELSSLGREYHNLTTEIARLQQQEEAVQQEQNSLNAELENTLALLRSLPPCPISGYAFSSILDHLTSSEYSSSLKAFSQELTRFKHLLDERGPFYDSLDPDMASAKLEALQRRKESLSVQSASARLPDCLVVAATLDGFIGKLSDLEAFAPVHVFLDEAAYSPLIKGITLLSLGVPLTMLGDHMQLPPVCEASHHFIKTKGHESICLWELSALYMEPVFEATAAELYRMCFHSESPVFERIKRFDLTYTFRFGVALADVLEHFVYHSSFCGNPKNDTSIFYISAEKNALKGAAEHTNVEECLAIRHLLRDASFPDYAVLTPYRNQRELLARQYVNPDDVYTIHGSQGREWDTVILSVVETTQHWFLTPPLINTAVSRAKRSLIIVCDVEYWIKQKEKIIGGLLLAGKPYSSYDSSPNINHYLMETADGLLVSVPENRLEAFEQAQAERRQLSPELVERIKKALRNEIYGNRE